MAIEVHDGGSAAPTQRAAPSTTAIQQQQNRHVAASGQARKGVDRAPGEDAKARGIPHTASSMQRAATTVLTTCRAFRCILTHETVPRWPEGHCGAAVARDLADTRLGTDAPLETNAGSVEVKKKDVLQCVPSSGCV